MKKFLIILIVFTSNMLNAQIPDGLVLSPTEVWNINIQNPKAQQVYLIGTIKDNEDKLLIELRSESFMLEQGQNIITIDKIKTIKTDWKDDASQKSVVKTGNFPKGTYSVCTKIINKATNKELAHPCRKMIVESSMIKNEVDEDRYKDIHTYGSASIDYNYSDPLPIYSQLPPQYLRIEAEQGLSIYTFPISGMFRYTTEKTEIKRDVDMFSLRFDRSRFERNIKQLILKKLVETQLKKVKMNEEDLIKLTQYENLEQELKSALWVKLEDELKKIKSQLTEYSKQKQTTEIQEKRSQLNKKYNQLLEKKRKLEELKSRYAQLKSLYNNWQESGRLQELKDLAYNPPNFSDPKELLPYLKKYGSYTGMNKFLFNIKELSVGTSYPAYTPLTLNGTQVFGGNLEWNPGLFFMAVCAGKVHSSVALGVDTLSAQFSQKVVGTRLGFGKIYGSYLSFNLVRFWDKDSSIVSPLEQELYPEQSWTASTDFNLILGKRKWFQIGGEIAGLFANQNNYDTTRFPGESLNTSISNEILNISSLKPNRSSNFDLAYNGQAGFHLFNDNTHVEYERQFAGPGFIHPGVFGLPNDLQRNKYRIKQELLNDKTSLSLYVTDDTDNFSDAKSYRSDRNELGIEWRWNSGKLPDLNLRLAQSKIKNQFYFFNTTIAQLGLNKPWKLSRKWSMHSAFQSLYYNTSTDSVNQKINTVYLFAQQSINMPRSFQIQLSGQWSNNSVAGISRNITGGQINISKTFFKKIRLGSGVSYTSQDDVNRFSIQAQVQGQIIKNMELYCKYNLNQFSEYPNFIGAYQENWLQTGLRFSW